MWPKWSERYASVTRPDEPVNIRIPIHRAKSAGGVLGAGLFRVLSTIAEAMDG
jgi:hypothetical protein